jgi:hypothetical protein
MKQLRSSHSRVTCGPVMNSQASQRHRQRVSPLLMHRPCHQQRAPWRGWPSGPTSPPAWLEPCTPSPARVAQSGGGVSYRASLGGPARTREDTTVRHEQGGQGCRPPTPVAHHHLHGCCRLHTAISHAECNARCSASRQAVAPDAAVLNMATIDERGRLPVHNDLSQGVVLPEMQPTNDHARVCLCSDRAALPHDHRPLRCPRAGSSHRVHEGGHSHGAWTQAHRCCLVQGREEGAHCVMGCCSRPLRPGGLSDNPPHLIGKGG